VVTVYNFCMSFASGVLFFFLSRELLSIYHRQSAFELFCNQHVANVSGWLIFLYYVNYVFKYVELVDTVFLVLRARQTPFLHVYHHAITLCLCWTQLRVETCMQWVSQRTDIP
jgi:fatty acid elongase 3